MWPVFSRLICLQYEWIGLERTEVLWIILFVYIILSVLIHWRQEKLEITLAFCRNCVPTFLQIRGWRRMWSYYLPLSSREPSSKSSYLSDKIGRLSLPSKHSQMNMFWSEAWKKTVSLYCICSRHILSVWITICDYQVCSCVAGNC